MIYVFDSSIFINLFRFFYPSCFPSLWEKFDKLVIEERITSVREVKNELEGTSDDLEKWVKNNSQLFSQPTYAELQFVSEIFSYTHFQALIHRKQLLEGKPVADPFLIAKAKVLNGYVVTDEKLTPNGAKIPNVCKHFEVNCTNFEKFMELEKWRF